MNPGKILCCMILLVILGVTLQENLERAKVGSVC